jgi:hypothetical protein
VSEAQEYGGSAGAGTVKPEWARAHTTSGGWDAGADNNSRDSLWLYLIAHDR